jgi:hypothetical protein
LNGSGPGLQSLFRLNPVKAALSAKLRAVG